MVKKISREINMNTFIADNADLEMWEGWVGDTQSVAATWMRGSERPSCGFQLFCSWSGVFTLLVLEGDEWDTLVSKSCDIATVRQAIFRYMSEQIMKANERNAYNRLTKKSFSQAHQQLNLWLNEQVKVITWLKQQP